MNALFLIIFLSAAVVLLVTNPESLFSVMLEGGEKALKLTITMLAVYAVCMGLLKIMENSGLTQKLSRLLTPLNKKLFLSDDKQVNSYISTNLSANLLGLGGVATPMGIKGMEALSRRPHSNYTTAMFFVINATSLQLLPLSIIALRASYDSNAPSDILLPCILSTLVSTIVGVLLVKIFIKKK